MVDFVSLAATALRLINENGRAVTIRQLGNTPVDVAQPWRGPTDELVPVRDSQSGIAIFTTDRVRQGIAWGLATDFIDGVKSSSHVCLFPASSDGGKNLEEFDEIVDGSTIWRIVRAELLQPGDTKILYAFEVMR